MEDEENTFSINNDRPLLGEKKMNENKKIIIFLVCLNILVIGLSLFVIISYFHTKENNHAKNINNIKVLKYDKDFIKPKIKLNAEFELVKVKNNMKGFLISDSFSSFTSVCFFVSNGSFSDTIGGLAHLNEHMVIAGGSKNYKYYTMLSKIFFLNGVEANAVTLDSTTLYYIVSKNNFKIEKAIDILIDCLTHPLYDEKIIEKEIQPINSEFYLKKSDKDQILLNIIKQLSSNETSFNGFSNGNNQTLKPNESAKLSKILKGYHNLIYKPENINFILYSNKSIIELEEYVGKYFNFKMHEFPENEIDIENNKKLMENIKNLKEKEIFDNNLYQHGIIYSSNNKINIIDIFFYIGKIDFKDLQFDMFEYYEYLFNSKSLLKILIEKNYVVEADKIKTELYDFIENNYYFSLRIILLEKEVVNIKELLIIIYKYIDIMKKEGYKKEYFDNFIKIKKK